MFEQSTRQLGLPLLQPAQAQKHVTVNEALLRLDGLAHLVFQGMDWNEPPENPVDGQCWTVGMDAAGGWEGRAQTIAIAANGGWVHLAPHKGMRGYSHLGEPVMFDGSRWRIGAMTMAPSGAGMSLRVTEGVVRPKAGAVTKTGFMMPLGGLLIGITARVDSNIGGTLTSLTLGTGEDRNRFGSIGKAAKSTSRGMLSQPMVYWEDTALSLYAVGGNFSGNGAVTVAAHWLDITVPG